MFVYDGAYLAFREVSLSYSLPGILLEEIGMDAVTLSVTGQNLGYLTASKLNRPEMYGSGAIASGYPSPRKLIFGVNVKF